MSKKVHIYIFSYLFWRPAGGVHLVSAVSKTKFFTISQWQTTRRRWCGKNELKFQDETIGDNGWWEAGGCDDVRLEGRDILDKTEVMPKEGGSRKFSGRKTVHRQRGLPNTTIKRSWPVRHRSRVNACANRRARWAGLIRRRLVN